MKTIKVIDLIIAISKKEKVPYKIEFDGKKMVYDGNKQDYFGYYSNGNGEWLFQYLFDRCKNTGGFINKFVKIIEEDKEIEILIAVNGSDLVDLQKNSTLEEQNKSVTNLIMYLNANVEKTNELVRAVNELKKGK